ncbi:MAG: CBS domain-containing protein [Pyrinomonadaceae bacterium]
MMTDVGFCILEDNLIKAAEIMRQKDCGVVPVVNAKSKVVGIITDRDICIAVAARNKKVSQVKVKELTGGKIIGCAANDKIEDALKKMRKNQLKRLPVTDKSGKLVGILSLTDILISVRKDKKLKKKVYSTLKAIFQSHPIVLQEVDD